MLFVMGHPLLDTEGTPYECRSVQKQNRIISISPRLIEFSVIQDLLRGGYPMHVHKHVHTCINMIFSIANDYPPYRNSSPKGTPIMTSLLMHVPHACMCVHACVHGHAHRHVCGVDS